MEWGTPVQWGRFLLSCVPQSVKTKETNPTRPGSPTPCKQTLKRLSCFLHLYSQVPNFPCECDGKSITLLQAVKLALKLSIRIPFQIGDSPSAHQYQYNQRALRPTLEGFTQSHQNICNNRLIFNQWTCQIFFFLDMPTNPII